MYKLKYIIMEKNCLDIAKSKPSPMSSINGIVNSYIGNTPCYQHRKVYQSTHTSMYTPFPYILPLLLDQRVVKVRRRL